MNKDQKPVVFHGRVGFVGKEEPNFLKESERVLNNKELERIKNKGGLIQTYNGTELHYTDEMMYNIETFKTALSNLPKEAEFNVTLNGDDNRKLKVNLEVFISDMVKDHFK